MCLLQAINAICFWATYGAYEVPRREHFSCRNKTPEEAGKTRENRLKIILILLLCIKNELPGMEHRLDHRPSVIAVISVGWSMWTVGRLFTCICWPALKLLIHDFLIILTSAARMCIICHVDQLPFTQKYFFYMRLFTCPPPITLMAIIHLSTFG